MAMGAHLCADVLHDFCILLFQKTSDRRWPFRICLADRQDLYILVYCFSTNHLILSWSLLVACRWSDELPYSIYSLFSFRGDLRCILVSNGISDRYDFPRLVGEIYW